MSTINVQYLQLVAWFVAIIEFTQTVYILLLNPRHTANRHVAALFLLITLNTVSVGLVLDATEAHWVGLPIFAATTTAIVPMLLIVTAILVKPDWLPGGGRGKVGAGEVGAGLKPAPTTRPYWWLAYALVALPIVLTAIDVAFGTWLWYTPPDASYAGGYLNISTVAAGSIAGLIRAPLTYVTGVLPILLLVYILVRDRTLVPATGTGRLAWVLLVTQIVALVLMSTQRSPVSGPLAAMIIGGLYTAAYAYAAFAQMISERRAQVGRLQTRLTILLLITAVPLFGGTTALLISQAEDEISLKAADQLAAANRSVTAGMSTWLSLNVDALNTLVTLPDIVSMDAGQQKPTLEAMANAHPHMYLVSTTDTQGFNVSRNDDAAPKDYSDRAWFQGAMRGAPLTLQTLIGRTGGQPALVASAPIQTELGTIVGVGMFASELTDLSQQVQRSTVGETGLTYVIDANNVVVATSDPEAMAVMSDTTKYAPVAALRQGTTGLVPFTDSQGQHWQAYVTQIELGWGTVVQQPREEFRKAVTGLERVAATFIAVGAAVLLGIVVLTIRQVLRPIVTLTDTATAIAGGDLARSAPPETTASQDEIGILARAFDRMTGQLRGLIGSLEQRVADRTADLERRSNYLQATAEVGRAVGSILNVEALSRQVVELIRDRFQLYYVGLFMTDPASEWAVLQAGTGEAGRTMLARGHRVQIGTGMIGWSIAHGEARVALEAGVDAVRLATPELPETRSEAALPLRSRSRVVGALTVQSSQPGAFDPDSLAVMQTMADQVAVALDNARLFAESQEALEATRRAYGDVRHEAWSELLRSRPEWGYRYARLRTIPGTEGARGEEVAPAEGDWRPEMLQVAQTGQPAEGDGTLAVPLRVRDQVVGALSFRKAPAGPGEGSGGEWIAKHPDDRSRSRPEGVDQGEWTADERALIGALVDQTGLALESAQAFQNTQRRAIQERLAGEVTTHIRETLDVETVLKTAVEQVRQALGLPEVIVRLRPPASAASRGGVSDPPAGSGNDG